MAHNLQSLITILEKILNPKQTRWSFDHNKPQLQSLLEKAVFLQQILEKSPLTKIESLESQMRDASHEAEDMIESHMVSQMLSNPEGVSFTFSTPDLQQVMQQLDSAMEQLVKLIKGKTTSRGSSSSGVSSWSDINPVKSKVVVGVDGDLMQLKDRLLGDKRNLEMVPIVGMGGIGKTTLARILYQDPSIVSHFEYAHAWATISQDYNMKAILLSLLRCIIGKECDRHIGEECDELKDILYRSLYGRRYLIVLDDIWCTKFWDEIRLYFPDNNNKSRIMITTRESDMAKHANSRSLHHRVELLSESTSWDLLCQIVFGEEKCPDILQGIGEKIASDCGGLPLAINVIGGLLSKVQRLGDVWENIAKDVRAAIAKSDEQFCNILSLSYHHLPTHLKPCFLYMGVFPEDYEIKNSKLVHLLVAEGFVKSNGDKSLEEEAVDYLKALVERNLLLVKEEKWNGKAKRFSIHDLLRDLCMRKAYEDKFLYVKNSTNVRSCNVLREGDEDKFTQFPNSRRVSIHAPYRVEDVYASPKLMSLSLTRSCLLLSLEGEMMVFSLFPVLRLVRVLDVMDVWFIEFPPEILQLVNLRFLALWCGSSIPSGISRLWNLQTFISSTDMSALPFEIWELFELRHLELVNEIIWFRDESAKQIVCKKVHTISSLLLSRSLLKNAFFENIPNIKDLGIYYGDELQLGGVDLSHLRELKTLRCESKYVRDSRGFWSTLKFSVSLRKLIVCKIAIFPRVSTLLCALPNLEVLKIKSCAFKRMDEELEAPDQGWEEEDEDPERVEAFIEDKVWGGANNEESEVVEDEWEVAEGDEFHSLKFLSLAHLRLKRWRADETNFPRLRKLRLTECGELEEIPTGIGEIMTLQLIELDDCIDSVVASARQIQEVQQSDYGNYDLKLRIK